MCLFHSVHILFAAFIFSKWILITHSVGKNDAHRGRTIFQCGNEYKMQLKASEPAERTVRGKKYIEPIKHHFVSYLTLWASIADSAREEKIQINRIGFFLLKRTQRHRRIRLIIYNYSCRRWLRSVHASVPPVSSSWPHTTQRTNKNNNFIIYSKATESRGHLRSVHCSANGKTQCTSKCHANDREMNDIKF